MRKLFQDDREKEEWKKEYPGHLDGGQIIKEEVKYAMKMKGKAAGEGVRDEMLEALGDFAKKNITRFVTQIYNEGAKTQEMWNFIFLS